ncbi:MAG: FAD-binding oxidoreductase [Acidimicrobiales bacterium]|nr:FAD-binding oxidoreductase [Acidimicrobiales bacterium]
MARTGLLDELAGVVGTSHVLTGDLTAAHVADWTGRWTGGCAAVVRPASTAELAAVVEVCSGHGAPMVAQGGNTGLVGGAVPEGDAVVLSTSRLRTLGPVDAVSGQVTAGAGVTVAEVLTAARRAGWRYAVDFAARDTATIGGSIATNAGGHHVLRFGMTRRQLVGIEAVLADGRVLSHLGGLVKDNTGYDLAGLFCGSEGTLGIVTAARLALVPEPGPLAVALVGFADLHTAIGAIGPLRRALPEVEAIELMLDDGLAAVGAHLGVRPPVADPVVLLIETGGGPDPVETLVEAVASAGPVGSTAVGSDPRSSAEIWRWREAHTEVINAVGPHPPHKLDVTLPLDVVAEFVPRVRAAVRSAHPDATTWIFGHAGDGNLHVNVTGPVPEDGSVDEIVLRLVADVGGSISAEHGIGRVKRPWLHLNRSAEEIDTFRAIKAALDPDGLFNPGVLLP